MCIVFTMLYYHMQDHMLTVHHISLFFKRYGEHGYEMINITYSGDSIVATTLNDNRLGDNESIVTSLSLLHTSQQLVLRSMVRIRRSSYLMTSSLIRLQQ